jgi:uncharacterized protein YecE (DUF72 family)
MLAFYAERLGAVEINNSFYRMPSAEMLAGWAAETPPGFRFALKSPRRITHEKKLLDVAPAVERLTEASLALGDKLGPILFQLPPFMKKDLVRLDDFLASLPKTLRPAVEFRHEFCVAESEELATPFVATTGWGYLRLRRQDYDQPALAAWADRVKTAGAGWETTYVFFKHEEEGKGPTLATAFGSMMMS